MHNMLLKLVVMVQPQPPNPNEPGDFRNVKPSFDFPGLEILRWAAGGFLALVAILCVFIFFAGLIVMISGLRKGKEGVGVGIAMALMSLIVGALALAGTNAFFDISSSIPSF